MLQRPATINGVARNMKKSEVLFQTRRQPRAGLSLFRFSVAALDGIRERVVVEKI